MKRLWLPLLALFLSVVILGWPQSVSAQSLGPTSCSGTVDITDYVAPCQGGTCPTVNASSISNSVRHVGNVSNSVEWISGNRFKQNSNEIHFLYELTGTSIKFLQDTIWEPFRCSNGKDAMYRVNFSSTADWGAELLPRSMQCGAPHSYTTRIDTYEYDTNVETQVDMPLNQCSVAGQSGGVSTNVNELFFEGTATCNNLSPIDVIGVRNISGAGAGEVYFYCKGYGLCAWYQNLDFGSPGMDPREWTAETDVCDLKAQLADYYLYPIKGLPTETAPGDAGAIVQDLAMQGYQSQCTTPEFSVQVVEGGDIELLKTKIANSGGTLSPQIRTINSTETVDYASVQVPVLRDYNPLSSLFASLEDFWGYQDTNTTGRTTLEQTISSSFMYSQLSLKDQCQFKVNILKTIDSMCNKLTDPAGCALYQQIPNAGTYTTKTVHSEFGATGLNCSQVALGQYSTAQKPVVDALMKTPLYLDKAYRLAFLVMVSELKPGNPLTDFFNFLRDPGGTATPRDEVRVIAFKVPDIGTNRPDGELNYKDPFQITRDILLDDNHNELNALELQNQKQALANGGVRASGGVIDCDGTEACQDPLVKAVVSLVNTTGQTCTLTPDKLEYEPSDTIQTPGGLADTDTTEMTDGTNPSKNLFSTQYETNTGSTTQKGIFKFLSDVRIGDSGANNSKVRSYLVYPVGQQLRTVEDTLMAFVELQTGESVLDDPELKDYFRLNGVEQNLSSSKAEVNFTDNSPDCVPAFPGDPCTNQKTATAEIGSDQSLAIPRILGGRLGYLTRLVQATVNMIDSGQLAYIRSCKTTEDFLLNRCSGVNPADANTRPPSNSDYLNTEVVATNDCRSVARIGAGLDIDKDLPASRFESQTCSQLGLKTTAEQANLRAVIYSNTLNIPEWRNGADGDMAALCNEAFYKKIVCLNGPGPTEDGRGRQGNAPALIAHRVDSSGNFSPQGSMTACEYVVGQAKQNNISPRLALAMWAEESGFSAVPSQGDFGVPSRSNLRESGSLRDQLSGFMGTINNPKYTTYLGFLLGYSGESVKSELPPVRFCNNRRFPDNLYYFYDAIKG